MAGMQFAYPKGAFASYFAGQSQAVNRAADQAVVEVGNKAKAAGRAAIAGAGFSQRFQNTLRLKFYPYNDIEHGVAYLSQRLVSHEGIEYGSIFLAGQTGTVRGKPLLWIPVGKNIPGLSGRGGSTHPISPAEYIRRVGPLIPVFRSGHAPVLIAVSKQKTSKGVKFTGRRKSAGVKEAPFKVMYVGLTSVTISKKYDLRGVINQMAATLPAVFLRKLKEVGGHG